MTDASKSIEDASTTIRLRQAMREIFVTHRGTDKYATSAAAPATPSRSVAACHIRMIVPSRPPSYGPLKRGGPTLKEREGGAHL